jgi:hypothetical protein
MTPQISFIIPFYNKALVFQKLIQRIPLFQGVALVILFIRGRQLFQRRVADKVVTCLLTHVCISLLS